MDGRGRAIIIKEGRQAARGEGGSFPLGPPKAITVTSITPTKIGTLLYQLSKVRGGGLITGRRERKG
jgi:hypothetical protein